MDYVYGYLLFLAQAATIVVAVLLVFSGLAALGMRRQQQHPGHLEVRKLNDHFLDLKLDVEQALLPPAAARKARKQERKAQRAEEKAANKRAKQAEHPGDTGKRSIYVLDFDGDLQASQVEQLRTEITAVVSLAQPTDEILVRLESPGGMVHGYGLAASQLERVRQRGIPLVAAVDRVAASGGYLMAAVADRILAAPFAVIGSIGVVAQVPNVHRLLKRHDVDVEVLTAGKYKRTLTVLGENTDEGRRKFIEELEDVHRLFQGFVSRHRPQLDLAAVATGEVWHGEDALAMKLVDEISTSDEYLLKASEEADIFEVRWVEHRKPIEQVLSHLESSVERLGVRWVERLHRWRGGL